MADMKEVYIDLKTTNLYSNKLQIFMYEFLTNHIVLKRKEKKNNNK